MSGLKLEQTKPVALSGATITIEVRDVPEPITKPKTKGGKPLYIGPDGEDTPDAETVVYHPKNKDQVLTRFNNPVATEPVKDKDGNPMFDYVQNIRITQRVASADSKRAGTLSVGTEADLTDEEKAGLLATFLSFRKRLAKDTKLAEWPAE